VNWYKNFLLPTGLLAGTIIGAGVFALPFLFATAGVGAGFVYLAMGAAAYAIIHILYADIIVRTPGNHRFPGFAKLYLGRGAFSLAILMSVAQMLLVLTIYLILSASFIRLAVPFAGDLASVAVFWVLGSAAIFLSLRRLALSEFFVTGAIVAIIGAIFFLGIRSGNTWLMAPARGSNWLTLLLPLGAVLFSLSGRVAIPSLIEYFKKKNAFQAKRVLSAIVWGTVIPAIVYGLFVIGIIALSPQVSEDAISGLVKNVPAALLAAVGVLGFLSIWSSYIMVGLDVKNIFAYDLRFPHFVGSAIVVATPLLLYVAGLQNFIGLVGFTGGIFLGLEGIFVIAMWRMARAKNPHGGLIHGHRPLLLMFPFFIFLTALIYEVIRAAAKFF
jgi:amino acid permease